MEKHPASEEEREAEQPPANAIAPQGPQPRSELERMAADESRAPFLADFLYFLRENKKWWLLPILIILLLLSMLMLLSSSAVAPFVYTLF